jgi:tetratricopeptide (TPR) repeat protein
MSTLSAPQSYPRKQNDAPEPILNASDRALSWFDLNRNLVYGVLAGITLLIVAIFAYNWWSDQQEAEAQAALAGAVRVYERGDYRAALDGVGTSAGLLAVAEEYGGTDAGNLAHFYAADALYNLGETDAAFEHFGDYDGGSTLLGASALAGQAAILESRGEFDEAGALYMDAAEAYESAASAPGYLMNAGRAFYEAGDYAAAVRAYEMLEEDYPDAPEAQTVGVFLARARAAMN